MPHRGLNPGPTRQIQSEKITVLPPWSHDDVIHYDPPGCAVFRQQYGLTGKVVVIYSGNHSPCHPLNTVLEAALRLTFEGGKYRSNSGRVASADAFGLRIAKSRCRVLGVRWLKSDA